MYLFVGGESFNSVESRTVVSILEQNITMSFFRETKNKNTIKYSRSCNKLLKKYRFLDIGKLVLQ